MGDTENNLDILTSTMLVYKGKSKVFQSLYILVCSTWLKQFKLWIVPAVAGSIVVVGVLTYCALFLSVWFESCSDKHAV